MLFACVLEGISAHLNRNNLRVNTPQGFTDMFVTTARTLRRGWVFVDGTCVHLLIFIYTYLQGSVRLKGLSIVCC